MLKTVERRSGRFGIRMIIVLAIMVAVPATDSTIAAPRRPNVILIMTDNHGAWTLGCYGNRDIRTPNIDRLAREGTLFEECFSCNPVCSPTRASWLTGLMPSQHGVHCFIAPSVQIGPKAFNTLDGIRSLPEILQHAGYVCGLSGKWHLGKNMEPQEGFTFWVTKPGGSTSEFYDQQIIENGTIKRVAEYQTDYWTRRGIEFIRQNQERPFFLFLAYNGPYGLSPMLLKRARNRHAAFYDSQQLPSFPRRPMHPWLYNNRDYLNNIVSMRRYAAEISGVDDGVGQIMATLRQLGLDQDTLVVFTADQGLAGGQGGVWGMGDHTRPLSAFDSTMQVPLIYRWPGHVRPSERIGRLVSNYDFLPTILSTLGLQSDMPKDPPRPGRDYSADLESDGRLTDWDDTVYYEFETVRAVRTKQWKLVERLDGGPVELYHVSADPEEQQNLAGSESAALVDRELHEKLRVFFERYSDPRYNLASGGKSKAQFLHSESPPVVRASRRDGAFMLDTTTVRLNGERLTRSSDWRAVEGWRGGSDRCVWSVRGVRAGLYDVTVALRGASDQLATTGFQGVVAEIDKRPVKGQWVTESSSGAPTDTLTLKLSDPVTLKQGDHDVRVGIVIGDRDAKLGLTSVKLSPRPARAPTAPKSTAPKSTAPKSTGIDRSDSVVPVAAILQSSTTSPVIESKHLRLQLREDLKGIAHLIDKRTQRDLAADVKRPLGLYCLYFGRDNLRTSWRVSSTSVTTKNVQRHSDHLQLEFEHKDSRSAHVSCRVYATPDQPGIRWEIEVSNRSNQPLYAIEYPRFTASLPLGDDSQDDRLVCPQSEGIMLCDPTSNLPEEAHLSWEYPGRAGTQFMYLFDGQGGLYTGCHDVDGHAKQALVERSADGLLITYRHRFSSIRLARSRINYDVVWQVADSNWQSGAELYRQWAEAKAPWCEKKLSQRAGPEWLKKAHLFLNFNVLQEGRFDDVARSDAVFQEYQEFVGVPIVACGFNWEKNGAWIGPEYFPPRGGDEFYRQLADRLRKRDGHLHLFTSGFRWGVRKTVAPSAGKAKTHEQPTEVRSKVKMRERRVASGAAPREYTPFQGRKSFYAHSRAAVRDARGRHILERPAWADNYLLCAGSADARDILSDCFKKIYDYGVDGVDLDQNIGAGITDCYSTLHRHPPGSGRWKYTAMAGFFEEVRKTNLAGSTERFIGLEEPCEVFLPWIDVVHGRAFTDTSWPANGPGAVSIPLYLYLYHEYQPTYAGWIDQKFSPFGDVRWGIGRATIFGMLPGVRISSGPFVLDSAEPSEALQMLRRSTRLLDRAAKYLLTGRMQRPPILENVTASVHRNSANRASLPLDWPSVQATAWEAEDGNVFYAVANLADREQVADLIVESRDPLVSQAGLNKIDADSTRRLAESVALPARISMRLKPWEVSGIEVTR